MATYVHASLAPSPSPFFRFCFCLFVCVNKKKKQDIMSVPQVSGVCPPNDLETFESQQVASDCLWSDPAKQDQARAVTKCLDLGSRSGGRTYEAHFGRFFFTPCLTERSLLMSGTSYHKKNSVFFVFQVRTGVARDRFVGEIDYFSITGGHST